MGQAQINVRTRACSRTSIARTRQAALTHNVRGKELNVRNSTFNSNSGDTPRLHRAVTLPFARTHYTSNANLRCIWNISFIIIIIIIIIFNRMYFKRL